MPSDCANPECENTISDKMQARFCFTCLSMLQRDAAEMVETIDHLLAFEAWCAANEPASSED